MARASGVPRLMACLRSHPGMILRFAAAALGGSALLHVIEYHLGVGFSGSPGQRLSAIAYMVAHCPLLGPAGGVLAFAVLVLIATVFTMRRQMALVRRLELGVHRPRTLAVAPLQHRRPTAGSLLNTKSVAALIACCVALAACQVLLFEVANYAVPMRYVMEMHGASMVMGRGLALPLFPVSLLIAAIGSALVLLFESRLEVIARAIAALLRAIFPEPISAFRPSSGLHRPAIHDLFGPALFSRPPPQAGIA